MMTTLLPESRCRQPDSHCRCLRTCFSLLKEDVAESDVGTVQLRFPFFRPHLNWRLRMRSHFFDFFHLHLHLMAMLMRCM
jgi:hypothetical protein